jgi:hypothetical protein
MIRKESTSRAFASYGYDPASKVVEIQYHTGHIYQHKGVPEKAFAAFEAAPSMGLYLNMTIKPNYPAIAIITCDRCHEPIDGIHGPGVTGGFYDVRPPSSWADYVNPGERFVCDNCMWTDPRYVAVYGTHVNTEEVPLAPTN